MEVRFAAIRDRMQSSLFVVPMLFVFGAIVLAATTLVIDDRIGSEARDVGFGFSSTVESARSLVSTVAGATITVAGIAFSITLLVFQLASSQYSPRVVHGLFRDPFNKRVMGFMVGVFTYCLVVLRSIRSPLGSDGEAVVPNVSVAIAMILGIASVLAIVAFINHNAHIMDVSEILSTVSVQTLASLCQTWPERNADDTDRAERCDRLEHADPGVAQSLATSRFVVESKDNGWLRYIDHEAILDALPAHTEARLEIHVGEFIIDGVPLCTIGPAPQDVDELAEKVRDAMQSGRTRTTVQDPSYGVRQLADVALKALSPGVNDPTTAADALQHIGVVLAEASRREPPPHRYDGTDGRVVVATRRFDHAELAALAFDEVRRDAFSHPAIAVTLLELIGTLLQLPSVRSDPANGRALREQAHLALEGCEGAGLLDHDLELVRAAYRTRIEPAVGGGDSHSR